MPLIIISNVGIFDGKPDNTQPARYKVAFQGSPGNIISVSGGYGPPSSGDDDGDAVVIDGTGCTLLPALTDCKVNVANSDSDLQTFASFGIATVLDMSSAPADVEAMRIASAAGRDPTEQGGGGMPSYLAAGTVAVSEAVAAAAAMAATTAAPTSAMTSAMSPLQLFPLLDTVAVRTPAEAEAFVALQVGAGPSTPSSTTGKADYIKVVVDADDLSARVGGGGGSGGTARAGAGASSSSDPSSSSSVAARALPEPVLAALVAASHRHGRLAVAHASRAAAWERAARAGFDIVTPVPMDAGLDAAMAAELAARGVACVPSLAMVRRLVPVALGRQRQQQQQRGGEAPGAGGEEAANNPHSSSPLSSLSTSSSSSSSSSSSGAAATASASAMTTTPDIDFSHALRAVQTLRAAGVRICAGTDANRSEHAPVAVGESMQEELELLVAAGLRNDEAVCAATSVPAAVFGLANRGAIRVGNKANMVLVEGNPTRDIAALKRIRGIWIDGIEIEPQRQDRSDV